MYFGSILITLDTPLTSTTPHLPTKYSPRYCRLAIYSFDTYPNTQEKHIFKAILKGDELTYWLKMYLKHETP